MDYEGNGFFFNPRSLAIPVKFTEAGFGPFPHRRIIPKRLKRLNDFSAHAERRLA
jgi:hypothetical protein